MEVVMLRSVKNWIIVILLLMVVGLSVLLAMQFINLKPDTPIVRKPSAPGESTVSYTPPPQPKVPLTMIKQVKLIDELMTPQVEKITDSIYLARGFTLGSAAMVITPEGLVIIDAVDNVNIGKTIMAEFRKISDLPVKYIIYTHGHIDHVMGTPAFMEEGTKIVATADAVDLIQKDMGWLKPFHYRCRFNQGGQAAPEYCSPMKRKSLLDLESEGRVTVLPTITFDREYSFTLGGRKFDLHHTWGETSDHLMVWVNDEKVLFCGDLYYESFPNLCTPMLEARDVKRWYESVERMAGFGAEYLVPGHGNPVLGQDQVRDTLTTYAKAIRYVYDETVKRINQGITEDQAVAEIKLPADMAEKTCLREFYGRVDWSVRGIYRYLTGWYDGHGTRLDPLPPEYAAREMVKLCGGADKILTRAIELQQAGEHQMVLEICDVVIDANPDDKTARMIKAASLEHMAFNCGNINMFGFYRSAAALERKAAGLKP
jgi:alkyl sulfatase BDS1-like metallo-beta-lactamase superfamily hydrolase